MRNTSLDSGLRRNDEKDIGMTKRTTEWRKGSRNPDLLHELIEKLRYPLVFSIYTSYQVWNINIDQIRVS